MFRKRKIFRFNLSKPISNVPKPQLFDELEIVDGKGFDNFDIVYYINLDHRKDRFEHITNELKKTNIDTNKINRIEAVNLPFFGELGCTKSHILALELFLKTPSNIQNCLILEDDFEFTVDQSIVNNLLNYFFKYFKNYNVLMLAANIKSSINSHHSFVTRILEARTTSGYCVNKDYALKLLKNYKISAFMLEKSRKTDKFALDSYNKIIQNRDFWYSFNPKIAKQKASYSDIVKNHMDYGC